jgi:hypothetical protein
MLFSSTDAATQKPVHGMIVSNRVKQVCHAHALYSFFSQRGQSLLQPEADGI